MGAVTMAVLVALALVASPAAADTAAERATLAGLVGVYVRVDVVPLEAEHDGLPRGALRADVELALRHAGIRVLSEGEWLGAPGTPFLYLNVGAVRAEGGLYAFCLQLELLQRTWLDRDRSILATAPTWNAGLRHGLVSAALLPTVRDDVRQMVSVFVKAYRAANPSR